MHINDELSIKSMTVNQVYSLFVEKKLRVNRQYQRKLCWTIEEKRNFIDTISNGYPVPLFLLAIDENGTYEIIDGMQRLDALCTFIEQKYELMDGHFNLESMPDTLQLKRNRVLHQKKHIISLDKCKKIANYPFPVSVFSAKDNSIEEVFKRINSTGKHLSQQELRQIGVNSEYAILVRQLSSEIRGDYSEDTLLLNEMSNISLSNYRLNYSININDIFWVKNAIINSNDLRQSRDEEIVAFLLAGIILDQNLKIYYTGTILNKFYGYSRNPMDTRIPIEMTRLQNAIDRVGIETIKNRFYIVMSCIKDVLAFSKLTFRNIIKADKSISDISIQFQIVFMAIYRLTILEMKRSYDIKRLSEKLMANGSCLNDTDVRNDLKINAKNDMIYGLICDTFQSEEIEDPAKDDWSMQCVNILNKSRTEQTLYDFKIGFVDYGATNVNKNVIEKVLKTLTAINNVGPNKTGYVLIGIADDEKVAKKYSDFYKIEYTMEGEFPIIGIEHDSLAVSLTLDRYTHNIKEYIKNSTSIPSEYIGHILTNMKTPILYGKQLIIFKTCFSEPVAYKNKYYIREFTDVKELEIEQYSHLFKNYFQK